MPVSGCDQSSRSAAVCAVSGTHKGGCPDQEPSMLRTGSSIRCSPAHSRADPRYSNRLRLAGVGRELGDADLRHARRDPGRHVSDARSVSPASGWSRGKRQESDPCLHHARPRRPLPIMRLTMLTGARIMAIVPTTDRLCWRVLPGGRLDVLADLRQRRLPDIDHRHPVQMPAADLL
jgi:hypothetical protein